MAFDEKIAANSASDARLWTKRLSGYRVPSDSRALLELAVTILPFTAAWTLMAVAINSNHTWIALLLAIPTAGLAVRLFMIQHDCGHGSFFSGRAANDWMGRVVGLLTFTPYDFWRRSHAVHHATAGNLDDRGVGDVDTLTVDEYLGRSRFGRLRYRLYRHPIVMFGLGPAYLFVLQFRLPIGSMRAYKSWRSTMGTNLAIFAASALLMALVGPLTFVMVHFSIVLLAASAGVWLFYVQHQFDDTHWSRKPAWSMHESALHGSSYYDLPALLRWFTANIGIHHVHHLACRIPFYRLPEVVHDYPQLLSIGRVTLRKSLAGVRLTLWDESRARLVSFREIASMTRRQAA